MSSGRELHLAGITVGKGLALIEDSQAICGLACVPRANHLDKNNAGEMVLCVPITLY